jgi:hypothetical protein
MKLLSWLKANWKWILFPIGLVMLLVGRGKKIVVAPSGLEEHDKVKRELDRAADEATEEAEARRELELDKMKEAQRKATEDAERRAKELAEKLKDDPKGTNDFLKSVGKDVRDK